MRLQDKNDKEKILKVAIKKKNQATHFPKKI